MQSLSILIIEDEILTALAIQETLEVAGHRITAVARNVAEAVKAMKQELPDLALVDVRLEESSEDGIFAVARLQAMHRIPIIYLTGNSEPETVQRAKLTAPAAYLIKPFRPTELVIQVELAYYHHQLNQDTVAPGIDSPMIYLPLNKGYEKITKSDVLYLQADGAYVKLGRMGMTTPLLLSMNLGHLAQYFTTPNFYRVSRSLLINLDHIDRLERNQLYMHQQKSALPVSESARLELMKKLTVIRTR
ncbi:MAG: DNA-binding response regulator [Cytophagales bacterium]|nr:MAG: DNA-binding response regulator [Cytophagales bacterium]